MRCARLAYRVSLVARRMEDVVIGDTLANVAHRADTLLAMDPAGLQLLIQDDHQVQVVPEVDVRHLQLVPDSASVAEMLCRSCTRRTARPPS